MAMRSARSASALLKPSGTASPSERGALRSSGRLWVERSAGLWVGVPSVRSGYSIPSPSATDGGASAAGPGARVGGGGCSPVVTSVWGALVCGAVVAGPPVSSTSP